MQAIIAWQQLRTPEAKAVMDSEEALLDRHVRLRFALSLGGLFFINDLLCYFFWNYGNKKAANKTLQATAATPRS